MTMAPIRRRPRRFWTSCSISRCTATFFLIDEHLTEDTAFIVRRMFDEGHAVALHAGSRAPMFKTRASLAAMLERNAARIEQLGGRRPCRLFRPHAGWRGGAMYEGLDRGRLSAGRLELGPVGLELVPRAARPTSWPRGCSEVSRWRHRRHARWPPCGSDSRSALCSRGDAPARAGDQGSRLPLWRAVRKQLNTRPLKRHTPKGLNTCSRGT